jgi:hypothetical protein
LQQLKQVLIIIIQYIKVEAAAAADDVNTKRKRQLLLK